MSKEYTWEDVIKECEDVLRLNEHAKSPLMCNLPNIIRDLIFKLSVYPITNITPAAPDSEAQKE